MIKSTLIDDLTPSGCSVNDLARIVTEEGRKLGLDVQVGERMQERKKGRKKGRKLVPWAWIEGANWVLSPEGQKLGLDVQGGAAAC